MNTPHLVRAGVASVIEASAQRLSNDLDGMTIRVIAASPTSMVAREIWRDLDQLADAKCVVKAVFGDLPDTRASDDMLNSYIRAFGAEAVQENVRVAAPLFAQKGRERLVLGETGVWTGEPLSSSSAGLAPTYILPAQDAGLAIAASRLAFDQAFRSAFRIEIAATASARKRA